jgi:hypothetical protein
LKLRGGGLQVFKLWGSNCKITDTSWVKSEFSPNLKIDNKNLKQEFFKHKDCFQEQDHNSDNDDNKSDHSYKGESNNTLNSNDDKIISLINKVILPKWYAKVHIVVA